MCVCAICTENGTWLFVALRNACLHIGKQCAIVWHVRDAFSFYLWYICFGLKNVQLALRFCNVPAEMINQKTLKWNSSVKRQQNVPQTHSICLCEKKRNADKITRHYSTQKWIDSEYYQGRCAQWWRRCNITNMTYSCIKLEHRRYNFHFRLCVGHKIVGKCSLCTYEKVWICVQHASLN